MHAISDEWGVAVHLGHNGAGGTSLNYITINGSNYRTKIILAHDEIDNAENVNSMLERASLEGTVAAAFVGTYFTPYDGSNITEGFLLQDGKVINPKWFDSYLVFTNDKEWRIMDRHEMGRLGYENLMTVVAADPRIIRDGQKSLEQSNGITSEDMTRTHQRTLVGVRTDGSLLIAEGATNYDRAADTLLALGCVDAMAVDGGASSFLYANGKTIQQAGRNLNNIVVVYEDAPESSLSSPGDFTAAEQSTALNAIPIASTVYINGEDIAFNAYTIEGANYFKIRDLAYAINHTNKQFSVGYDELSQAITLTSGQPYEPDGSEMVLGDGSAKVASLNANINIAMDNTSVDIIAYLIEGSNYVRLRDIMRLLDIGVGYDEVTRNITIDTSLQYIE
ncbi:MAG: phosphodiester glycosidase family protein [Oscillospiraceae bacterium]|nr:phosphodiester glycosidase family protein [Oscillospiraceae bacterium]